MAYYEKAEYACGHVLEAVPSIIERQRRRGNLAKPCDKCRLADGTAAYFAGLPAGVPMTWRCGCPLDPPGLIPDLPLWRREFNSGRDCPRHAAPGKPLTPEELASENEAQTMFGGLHSGDW